MLYSFPNWLVRKLIFNSIGKSISCNKKKINMKNLPIQWMAETSWM